MARLDNDAFGLHFSGVAQNASGIKDANLQDLLSVANSDAAAIVTKTTTIAPRMGNPVPRYCNLPHGSINSMGLPNPGIEQEVEDIRKLKKQTNKSVIASLQGFNAEEVELLSSKLSDVADILEINLSCPNVIGKPQVAYDFDTSEKYIEAAKKGNIRNIPITLKLPPFLEPYFVTGMYEVIKRTGISMITTSNTAGNALYIDSKNRIGMKPKWGGLGGEYIKPLALGNIRRFWEASQGKLFITGVGGIRNGRDAFEHILCGARHVAIGTYLAIDGVSIFEKVHRELGALLDENGFSSVEDAVGKAAEI